MTKPVHEAKTESKKTKQEPKNEKVKSEPTNTGNGKGFWGNIVDRGRQAYNAGVEKHNNSAPWLPLPSLGNKEETKLETNENIIDKDSEKPELNTENTQKEEDPKTKEGIEESTSETATTEVQTESEPNPEPPETVTSDEVSNSDEAEQRDETPEAT